MNAMTGLLATASVGAALLLATPSAAQHGGPETGRSIWELRPDMRVPQRALDEADAVRDQEAERLAAEQEVNAQALLTHLGQPVLAEDGDPLGLFLGLGRHADVPTPFALVRGPDEAVRYFRATMLSVGEDGLLLTSITAYQFRRLPELPPQR